MINLNPDLKEILNMVGGNANQDIGYSSGQRYAQSIAGGENVPNMIAPGVSYSAARPEGYTQADLQYYNPGPVPVMPSAPTKGTPFSPNEGFVQMPSAPQGVAMPEKYIPIIKDQESLKNLADLFNANMPSGLDPLDLQPTLFDIPFTPTVEPVVEPVAENLPSVGSSPIDFSFNPFEEIQSYKPIEIDPMPQPVDVPVDPMPSYFVPETPVLTPGMTVDRTSPQNPIFNPQIPESPETPAVVSDFVPSLQNNPTGPVDMPAEVFEDRMEDVMDYDDLQDIIRNKEVLTQIPAEDGVRNQYQVELDNYINESENKKETYLDTFPVGGAINLGIPNIFENVVAPAVIPGLGFAKEASQSFNNNNNFSAPSPAPSFNVPSPRIDYSNIYKFGR